MRLKIVSDGTPNGTHVINEKTGEEVVHVAEVTWHLHAGMIATATIVLMAPAVELIGETREEEDEA
jgi:hypothetical protein